MNRSEAEQAVWARWSEAINQDGCAMRIEPSLTEEYVWGWVVYVGPERRAELKRSWLYEKYACDHSGRSTPVGTKGLEFALKALGVIQPGDFAGLSRAQQDELWERLHRFTRLPAPVRAWDDPHDQEVITVREIAAGRQFVTRVIRDGAPDWGGIGGWQFLGEEEPTETSIAAIDKTTLLASDPTLAAITDLPVGYRAYRSVVGGCWTRVKLSRPT